MRHTDAASPEEAREGIAKVEGYLLWQAETARARAEAEAVADELGWLTTAQREELVRVLTGSYLDRSRAALAETAERIVQIRSEFQSRYERLRRRALASALGVCVLGLFVAGILTGH